MPRVDISANPRIPQYVDLALALSRQSDPDVLVEDFTRRMASITNADAFVSLNVEGLPTGRFKIATRVVGDGRDYYHPPSRFDELTIHGVLGGGGFLSEVISTPEPKLYHGLSLAGDPVMGEALAHVGSCVAVPLFDAGRPINWPIIFRRDPRGLGEGDLEQFVLRANLVSRVVKHLQTMKEVRRLNDQRAAQLEQIARIQQSLLPARTPRVRGLDIATSYLTSNEAGGDYFDFFEHADGRFSAMIADVSGHGAGAATVMAMLQTILRMLPDSAMTPAEALAHANRHLLSKNIEGSFVTAFFATFDPSRRRLTVANAGHNRPVLRRRDGAVETVREAASVPLAVLDDPPYEQATLELAPGETFVLYTDGIVEAFSPPEHGAPAGPGSTASRRMFGEEGLVQTLRACTGQPGCVIDSIHGALFEHTGRRARDDDQTIVAIRTES
ncbi:MAG: SpoIIE family protein phosphatase [Phycisphaerales bacterium]|nr:SpoIIE family protein phosphatase [Phycisphaerales bacterium]